MGSGIVEAEAKHRIRELAYFMPPAPAAGDTFSRVRKQTNHGERNQRKRASTAYVMCLWRINKFVRAGEATEIGNGAGRLPRTRADSLDFSLSACLPTHAAERGAKRIGRAGRSRGAAAICASVKLAARARVHAPRAS